MQSGQSPTRQQISAGSLQLTPFYTQVCDDLGCEICITKDKTHGTTTQPNTERLVAEIGDAEGNDTSSQDPNFALIIVGEYCIWRRNCFILLGDNIKQCRPKFNVRNIVFKAYPQDYRLCIVRTMKEYIERTERLRTESGNADGRLLISYIKPHRSVSKDTVARWLKSMLCKCGIDTKKYTAGSIRPASVSKAKALDVPIATIMAKAGWTQEATFAKYYNKDIQGEIDPFQEAVLGSV